MTLLRQKISLLRSGRGSFVPSLFTVLMSPGPLYWDIGICWWGKGFEGRGAIWIE